jgi:hypothetical protein
MPSECNAPQQIRDFQVISGSSTLQVRNKKSVRPQGSALTEVARDPLPAPALAAEL